MLWQRCVLWRRRTGNNEQTSAAAAAADDDDDDDDEPVHVSFCHYLYVLKALTSGVFSMSKHAQK